MTENEKTAAQKAVSDLISRAALTNDGGEAMRFSQAAVNAANAAIVLATLKRDF